MPEFGVENIMKYDNKIQPSSKYDSLLYLQVYDPIPSNDCDKLYNVSIEIIYIFWQTDSTQTLW